MSTQATTSSALDGGVDAMAGLALFGKTAAALIVVIVLILLATALLKRWQTQRHPHGMPLKVVATTAVGSRERVVIVEVDATWLVLGVGGGTVTKLHELPAASVEPVSTPASPFAQRMAHALRRQRGKRAAPSSDNAVDDDPTP
ncbi:flagellar biosynthetic protein FliO [Halomonas dongshanensis]|uniref:Flagellar protein n=1 Tax=Halomonas dongshanensis TaxID=2890835 RepID=A0ABT2EFH5_9GAMM|nr:flagellar biosynthetic protein FliO [Halomonas dongshanensis]MCS2610239.1 flagellar biosynthetic protein FliO [Halomonas dongshanensis]